MNVRQTSQLVRQEITAAVRVTEQARGAIGVLPWPSLEMASTAKAIRNMSGASELRALPWDVAADNSYIGRAHVSKAIELIDNSGYQSAEIVAVRKSLVHVDESFQEVVSGIDEDIAQDVIQTRDASRRLDTAMLHLEDASRHNDAMDRVIRVFDNAPEEIEEPVEFLIRAKPGTPKLIVLSGDAISHIGPIR